MLSPQSSDFNLRVSTQGTFVHVRRHVRSSQLGERGDAWLASSGWRWECCRTPYSAQARARNKEQPGPRRPAREKLSSQVQSWWLRSQAPRFESQVYHLALARSRARASGALGLTGEELRLVPRAQEMSTE